MRLLPGKKAPPPSPSERQAELVAKGRLRNIVMAGLRVLGSLDSEMGDGIKIDGTVIGDVVLRDHPTEGSGLLIVGPNGVVVGRVWARFALIQGRVEGELTAYRSEITGTVDGPVRFVHLPITPVDGHARIRGAMTQIEKIDYPDRAELSGAGSDERRRQTTLTSIAVAEAAATMDEPVVAPHPSTTPAALPSPTPVAGAEILADPAPVEALLSGARATPGKTEVDGVFAERHGQAGEKARTAILGEMGASR